MESIKRFIIKNFINIISVVLIIIFIGIFSLKPVVSESTTIKIDDKDKAVKSSIILDVQTKRVTAVKKAEQAKVEAEAKKQEEKQEEVKEEAPALEPTVQAREENVLSSGSGRVTYYSLNGGNVACGIPTTNSLYHDAKYGNVRGLAAGQEFPCGTIINIDGAGMGSFTGIVIDRGGAIGMGRRNMFDILVNNNSIAYQYGVSQVTYKVLRMGF